MSISDICLCLTVAVSEVTRSSIRNQSTTEITATMTAVLVASVLGVIVAVVVIALYLRRVKNKRYVMYGMIILFTFDPGGEISALMTTATVRMFVANNDPTSPISYLDKGKNPVACFSHNHIRVVGVILDAGCRERMSPV